MSALADPQDRRSPEQRVGRLVAQLRNHALWDSLLIFFPPLLVSIDLWVNLYRAVWIAPLTFILLSIGSVGAGLLAVVVRYRPLIPSLGSAARLVDERTGAQDRFLTLTTIETTLCPVSFVARLRSEAAAFLARVDFRREFPYHIKRSFYGSLLISLLAAVLFHLSMALIGSNLLPTPPYEKVRELAEKMAERPPLSALAYGLRTLAMKLEQPNVSEQEKQALIRDSVEQIEKQRETETEKEDRQLLGEASSALQRLEQAPGQQKGSEQGGGGVQSNLSQGEEGKEKPSQASGGGDSKDLRSAQQSNDMHQGNTARNNLKEQGKEKNQQSQGDGKSNQPDPSKSGENTGTKQTGKTQGALQEKLGRSRSEEIPQSTPPAERFYKPGEQGKDGVKGARYITVQLPEEVAADAKGEGTPSTPSKDPKGYPKAPVSNVPLPAHVPDAPSEKQQLPLEYRGIIR
jgi:hypothetical protein